MIILSYYSYIYLSLSIYIERGYIILLHNDKFHFRIIWSRDMVTIYNPQFLLKTMMMMRMMRMMRMMMMRVMGVMRMIEEMEVMKVMRVMG
jgi:hypothetical protein